MAFRKKRDTTMISVNFLLDNTKKDCQKWFGNLLYFEIVKTASKTTNSARNIIKKSQCKLRK